MLATVKIHMENRFLIGVAVKMSYIEINKTKQ